MRTRLLSLSLGVVLVLSTAAHSQVASPQAAAKADYSQEAYVIEEMATTVRFDNEGNRTREQVTRVRIKTDGGIQEWGLLTLPYQSANETVEVGYVRVRKADNTTISTPADNIQDLDSEITRSAPFYSDLREKHVAVKGLGKGDLLEYQVFWHPLKPVIPGQFWLEYNFHNEGIVLDERVEIWVPADRAVKFKGPAASQTVKTEGGSQVFQWTYSKKENSKEPESEKKKIDALLGRSPAPDVQFSSFQSWKEVGDWYWNLQRDRIEPSPAIKAKATELTKGLTDDAAKLQALYKFVSIQYRYIGIAFGIGRYQPHAADDVLSNNYGDCKDKQTLLAALAQASGITVYPALIGSSRKLDPDVPSPAQFDHIIGYLPAAQGKSALWLDTTPEVSPLGYLVTPLRDKPALVMTGEKSAELITTPADPPFPSVQTFKIEGKLSEDGTFDAHVTDTSHGDAEVVLRAAFRRVPQPQWKDLVQQISYGLGYAGTVSEVDASAPDALSEPFHFSYAYNRKDYPDWTNRQFTVPGHPFYMPPVRDDAKDPVWLGPPMETISDSKVELPKGYKPELPSDVDLKYDFGEYHASYAKDEGVLTAKRRLVIKMREVPVAELGDYRSFLKNMQNDVNRYVQTSSSKASMSTARIAGSAMPAMFPGFVTGIRNLPDSTSPEANRLEADGRNSAGQDSASAEIAFKRAVEADPKFTRGWVELASVYLARLETDAAIDGFRKAIDCDPKALVVRKFYAAVLMFLRRNQAALEAWQDVIKIAPDDSDANSIAGSLLIQDKRYAEALPYLEAAAKNDTSEPTQIRLGSAYLKAGQTEKGSAIFQKVLETDTKPVALNDIAYEMAEANTNLPKALEYAQRAVEAQERESHDVRLSSLLQDDLACTQKIGSFWDTLGWVEFRLGNLEQAETYLHAAWLLSQMAVVADHLGQVYEQEKKTEQAIHMYRLAVATPEGRMAAGDEPRKHLEHLGAKGPTTLQEMMRKPDRSGDELSEMRTAKLKHLNLDFPTAAITAEFFLLFNSSGKVEEASFVSGSERLRSATGAFSDVNFQVAFPPGSSARLVRRVIVMCSKISGCQAVMYSPGSVHSVN